MSVALSVGGRDFAVGTQDFFYAFFSTVAVRAEDGAWGSRYPSVMNDLYGGRLPAAKVTLALAEVESISVALASWRPDAIVWDADDRDARPPWGSEIASSIASLADYFWTSDGQPLLAVLREAMELASARDVDITIA